MGVRVVRQVRVVIGVSGNGSKSMVIGVRQVRLVSQVTQ